MLTLLLIIVFLLCVGLVWMEGLWSASILLLHTIFAGLIATSYFAPLAKIMSTQLPEYDHCVDFLSFWLLFAMVCSVLRLATEKLSSHRVWFIMPVEMAGRSILALLVGWLMVCLTCFSLHLSPLSEKPFSGGFQETAMSKDFLGMAPDQQWMALVQSCSKGSLSTLTGLEFKNPSEFTPDDFIRNYRVRRQNIAP